MGAADSRQPLITLYDLYVANRPMYFFRFRVKTKEVNGMRRVTYMLNIYNNIGKVLCFSIRRWYPIVEYLSLDARYIRGHDYELLRVSRYTGAGKIELTDIVFYNPECARRVVVFALSILGVEDSRFWVDRMLSVVRKLSPEAIDFWYSTARDRFVISKDGLTRRYRLLRVAKAIRTLYEKNGEVY